MVTKLTNKLSILPAGMALLALASPGKVFANPALAEPSAEDAIQTDDIDNSSPVDKGNSYSARLYADISYDDNISRGRDEKESDTKTTAGLNFVAQHQGRALNLALSYDIFHEHYAQSSFSDETRFSGFSEAKISTYPARYAWYIQHQQAIADVSSQAADTPDNLDQRSVLTTGPNFNLRLSPVDLLTLSARYINSDFKEQDANDTERLQGQLSWQHRLSTLTTMGLNYRITEVEGEDDSSRLNFNQQQLGLFLSGSFRWGDYSLEYGRSELEPDQSALVDDISDDYAQADISTSWAGESLGFSYSRDVTDSSIGLSQQFAADSEFVSGDTNFGLSDVIVRTRYQLFYTRSNAENTLGLRAAISQDRENYQTLQQDQKSQTINLSLNYALRSNLGAALSYQLRRREYIDQPLLGDEDYSSVQLALAHEVNERWSLTYSLRHHRRDNKEQDALDYESNLAAIQVSYRLR